MTNLLVLVHTEVLFDVEMVEVSLIHHSGQGSAQDQSFRSSRSDQSHQILLPCLHQYIVSVYIILVYLYRM